jgi:hypothetical protein
MAYFTIGLIIRNGLEHFLRKNAQTYIAQEARILSVKKIKNWTALLKIL